MSSPRMFFLFSWLTLAGLVPSSHAQESPTTPPPTSPNASGETLIQPSPYSFLEPRHKGSVSVFEAVPTAHSGIQRIYLSPLCRIIPLDNAGTVYKVLPNGDNRSWLFLNILYYYPDMFTLAADYVNATYKTTFTANQIGLMPVIAVRHSLMGTKALTSTSMGTFDSRLQLPESHVVVFDVPNDTVSHVTKMAETPGGIQINSTVYYNSVSLRKKLISWSAEDVRKTQSFERLNGSGASYVNVEQIRDILREISNEQSVIAYEDEDAPKEFDKVANDIFRELIERNMNVLVDNDKKAAEADEELRRGTGLTSQEFMPIQLSFTYVTSVLGETDWQEANRKAKEFRNNYQSQLKASASGRINIVSGRIGGSIFRDMSEQQEFRNETEFRETRSQYRHEIGNGVGFHARGLGLIERGHLNNNLSLMARQVAIKAVNLLSRLSIPSSTVDGTRAYVEQVRANDANSQAIDELRKQFTGKLYSTAYSTSYPNPGGPVDLGEAQANGFYQILASTGQGRALNTIGGLFEVVVGENSNSSPGIASVHSSNNSHGQWKAAEIYVEWDQMLRSHRLRMRNLPSGNGRLTVIRN